MIVETLLYTLLQMTTYFKNDKLLLTNMSYKIIHVTLLLHTIIIPYATTSVPERALRLDKQVRERCFQSKVTPVQPRELR